MKLFSKKNALVFGLDFLSKAAPIIFLPLYVAWMSQADYGIYTYFIYFVTAVSGIVNLGIPTALGALYAKKKTHEEGLVSTSTIIQMVVIAIILVVMLSTNLDARLFDVIMPVSENYSSVRWPMFFYIIFFVLYGNLSVIYQFSGEIINFQKYNAARLLLANGLCLLVIFYESERADLTRLILEPLIGFIFFAPLLIRVVKKNRFVFVFRTACDSFKIAIPIFLSGVVFLVTSFADKYYIQKSLGASDLAVYNLTLQLTLPLGFVFTTVNLVWLPEFFKNQADNEESFVNLMKQVMPLVIGMAVFLNALIILATNYIPQYYGYRDASIVFPLLAGSVILDGIAGYRNSFLILHNKSKMILLVGFISAFLLIVFGYYFSSYLQLTLMATLVMSLSLFRLYVTNKLAVGLLNQV